MTPEDFIVRFLKLVDKLDGNEVSVTTLARAADTTRDGLISFDEFLAFENLLCTADALYSLAFELFDRDGDGYISFDDFREVLESTLPNVSIPFDFDCDFVSLHFGKDRKRQVSSEDFTQLIHDLNDEHAVQAFKRFDQTHTGTISVTDFNNIMLLLKNHMLTKFVRDNLLATTVLSGKHGKISFSYYMGFINLLSNMELMKRVYRIRSHGDHSVEFTRGNSCCRFSSFCSAFPSSLFCITAK
ncbi:unnamed protein product [Dicrocoelium dendriticum]|nr:unnamed protein product [Dicrocoelium dendriticum]